MLRAVDDVTRSLSSASTSPSKRQRVSQSCFNPIKIASAQAAAAVDNDPPLPRLLKAIKGGPQHPSKGRAIIYWMRMSDLRLNDNRALSLSAEHAARDNIPLLVLFIISPHDYLAHDRGPRRVDFTLRNLKMLKTLLSERNIPLYSRTHTPRRAIPSLVISLANKLGCASIYGNIEYEVDELRRDIALCELAKEGAIQATFVHNKSIIEPGMLLTTQHKTYTVFSPYHRKWISELNDNIDIHLKDHTFNHSNPSSVKTSKAFSSLFHSDVPDSVPGFELSPEQMKLMEDIWPAGEQSASATLQRFLHTKSRETQIGAVNPLAPGADESPSSSRIARYAHDRDRVDGDTTSRLSVYLSSGVLSARACVRATMALQNLHKIDGRRDSGIGRWLQEIAWRDFYTDILAAYPRVSMGRPFGEKFTSVVWENHQILKDGNLDDPKGIQEDSESLRRWKEGKTGVPIVDAAMRCTNEMGWVHNRLRMISAMYLTKDLMIDWRVGECYFMQQLIDGDLASNNGGWQWCASTGADSCPYFRIFNPYSQSTKADPTGTFIRHWIPELRKVNGPEIHRPSPNLADQIGYPKPVIDHDSARNRALRRFKNPGST